MTRQHVLRTFKLSQFPLRKLTSNMYVYESSVIHVRYVPDAYQNGDGNIMVWYRDRRRGNDFDSPAKALNYIRNILSIELVPGNDFALNTGRRGELRLVVGGAA